MTTSDPPSDPGDSTRKIVMRLRDDARRREGASTVWRMLGGAAATIALTIAGYAVVLAQQAAIDHETVTRHEREIPTISEQVTEIREGQAAQTAILQRIEHRLDLLDDRRLPR